jgi:hypothetical protein
MIGNLYGLKSNSGMICRDHNCRKESKEGKGSFKNHGGNKMDGSIYAHHNQSRHITPKKPNFGLPSKIRVSGQPAE